MIFFWYDLWCHVSRRATESIDVGRRSRFKAKAKIDQFQLFVSVQQYILSFDVPMDNIPVVEVLDCLG